MSRTRDRIEVRDLAPGDWDDVAKLFGSNGACGGCWCMHWRLPRGGKLWEERKGARNRRDLRRLVKEGEALGCLASVDGELVGWCTVGPRADFPRLERTKALATEWDEDTWSVPCFFIPAGWRRRGVASALLRRAVLLARESGARRLEAYPVAHDGAGRYPDTFAFCGVPALFERAGFRDVTPEGNARPIYLRRFRGGPR